MLLAATSAFASASAATTRFIQGGEAEKRSGVVAKTSKVAGGWWTRAGGWAGWGAVRNRGAAGLLDYMVMLVVEDIWFATALLLTAASIGLK